MLAARGEEVQGRDCGRERADGRWYGSCLPRQEAAWGQVFLSTPFGFPFQSHTSSMPWSMETMSTSFSGRSLWRMPGWEG